jgi:sugar lactone lactonase YvrE
MTHATELFRDSGAILGESIVWDSANNAVLWCDITAGILHSSPLDGAVDGTTDAAIRMPAPLASFHPASLPAGGPGFVMSLAARVVLTDSSGSVVTELATIDHARDGMRLNEGKVDPAGRWVTGSMILVGDDPVGAFYRVTDDGATVLRGGIGVSNGLEWSLDGKRVYFTDTSVASIYTGTYTDEGDILDVETWHHGTPNDGLAIDVDGCLWSGLYGDGCVVRYDPAGRERDRIAIPAPNVTSVAFVGSTLFVATARENLTEHQLEDHPLSGGLFTIETTTSGFEPRSFAPRS